MTIKPDMTFPEYSFTDAMVQNSDVYVEVYPMADDDSGAHLVESPDDQIDFYDVCLRPDDFEVNGNDIYDDWENLSLEEADILVTALEKRFPAIAVNWIYT